MLLAKFDTIILDMNGTFMFGHDRFNEQENYGAYFRQIGGSLPEDAATDIVRAVFAYLMARYSDPAFIECFPSVHAALGAISQPQFVAPIDLNLLVETFAHFECGAVFAEYAKKIIRLAEHYQIGLVADIWAPKDKWLQEFTRAGIATTFGAMSFSSEHGCVKPSPKPFQMVMEKLGAQADKTVVIGDSIRRDLGGANAAGLPCILVGGARHEAALHCVDSLLNVF